MVVPRSLQEDLLRIPGVEGADIEGTGEQPAGLRIRIAAGADQQAVGSAIRRVLTEHGLGTDTRLPGEPRIAGDETADQPEAAVVEPAAPEPATEAEVETAAVAVLEDVADESDSVIDLTGDIGTHDPDTAADAPDVAEPPPIADPPEMVAAPAAATAAIIDDQDDLPHGLARVESVAVEEGRDGILVIVETSDGETARQVASSSEGGLDAAVIKATARLAADDAPDPVVVEIEERRIEHADIVMVVLDADGSIVAGSSVIMSGRSFALARATWAALSS